MRAAVSGEPIPDNGAADVFVGFAANLLNRADHQEGITYTTRRVNGENAFAEHERNPQMKAWYHFGAHTITGCFAEQAEAAIPARRNPPRRPRSERASARSEIRQPSSELAYSQCVHRLLANAPPSQ